MTDKTTLTRYANWCAEHHLLVLSPQDGHWVLFSEAHAIEQERDDLRAQKYHLQDRIAALETEVAEIRGSTSFGKHIAIEQERDLLRALILHVLSDSEVRQKSALQALRALSEAWSA